VRGGHRDNRHPVVDEHCVEIARQAAGSGIENDAGLEIGARGHFRCRVGFDQAAELGALALAEQDGDQRRGVHDHAGNPVSGS